MISFASSPEKETGANIASKDPAMNNVYAKLSVIVSARILPNLENIWYRGKVGC